MKHKVIRYTIYSCGVAILALGITLNTKTDLGVSPLIALPYSISQIWSLNFAFLAFLMYVSFVGIQMILKGKRRKLIDILQVPFSLVFSLLLQVFGDGYDYFCSITGYQMDSFPERLIILLIAVAFTGIGVSLTVNMNLIPNPADGLAKEVGIALHRNLGFGKNTIDITSVIITTTLSLVAVHHLAGVGIGTIVAMIGVGRCVAACNYLFKNKMLKAAGLTEKNH